MLTRNQRRTKIKKRVRSKVFGTAERPRLCVFRSNKKIYAQIINDADGTTLASAASVIDAKVNKVDSAKEVGKSIADKAKAAGFSTVVFDRNGYLYHGRVKSLAEGAREGGLNF